MTIDNLISLIRDVLVILASLVAGGWAFYKFRKLRMPEARLEISLSTSVTKNQRWLLVDTTIIIKNTGNVAVCSKVPNNPECTLEVRNIPARLKEGWLTPSDPQLPLLFEPVQYLKQFESWYPEEPFLLEPGTNETIHTFFATQKKGLLHLKCSFVDKDDNLWTAEALVDLIKSAATSHNTPHHHTRGLLFNSFTRSMVFGGVW